MNGQELHLLIVHLPVVGLPGVLLFYAFALRWRDERWQKLCWALMVLLAATAALAYFSGPVAFEQLEGAGLVDGDTRAISEEHALLGRVGFAGMVFLGLGAVVALLGPLQGTPPARPLRLGLAVFGWLVVLVMVWTAKEGGEIRHVELRHGDHAQE